MYNNRDFQFSDESAFVDLAASVINYPSCQNISTIKNYLKGRLPRKCGRKVIEKQGV